MRRRHIEKRATIGGGGFVDLTERDRADQHPIALDEREIGGHHQVGVTQHVPNAWTGFFAELHCQTSCAGQEDRSAIPL